MTDLRLPATSSSTLPRRSTTSDAQRVILMIVAGFIALNTLAILVQLWDNLWWALLFVNFVLLVMLAHRISGMIPARHRNRYETFLALAFPVIILIYWQLIVSAEILNPRWFPPPSKIGQGLWDLAVNYDRFNKTSLIGRPWLIPQQFSESGWAGVQALLDESHVWATLTRVIFGFFIGSIPGIFIGMMMGMNRTIRLMLDTTLSALYVLPKIAIFPLMMLIFPDPFGEGPKIAVVSISTFFLVAINTMTGVRDIDPVYLQAGRNYGANRWQMFRHVIIPGALPVIFSGLRLALGTGLIVIVAIEFIRAKVGVGYVVYYYWQIGVTEKMYAGLFMVMLLGILLTYSLQFVERRVMPWREK